MIIYLCLNHYIVFYGIRHRDSIISMWTVISTNYLVLYWKTILLVYMIVKIRFNYTIPETHGSQTPACFTITCRACRHAEC